MALVLPPAHLPAAPAARSVYQTIAQPVRIPASVPLERPVWVECVPLVRSTASVPAAKFATAASALPPAHLRVAPVVRLVFLTTALLVRLRPSALLARPVLAACVPFARSTANVPTARFAAAVLVLTPVPLRAAPVAQHASLVTVLFARLHLSAPSPAKFVPLRVYVPLVLSPIHAPILKSAAPTISAVPVPLTLNAVRIEDVQAAPVGPSLALPRLLALVSTSVARPIFAFVSSDSAHFDACLGFEKPGTSI